MTDDAGLLPHQAAAAAQLTRLFAIEGNRLCAVAGPSGSGKTFLAAHWNAPSLPSREPASRLVVPGQHTFQGTPLACWKIGLHGRRPRYGKSGAWHEIADDTMKAASKVTLGLSELVSVALGASKRFRKAPLTLTDPQFEILYEVASMSSGGLTVIADDLQWWDDQSIILLRAMLLDAFIHAFPALNEVRVIAVMRSDIEHSPAVARFLHDLRPPTVSLERPGLADTKTALRLCGAAGLSDSVYSALFAATGGHLHLIREVARYCASRHSESRVGPGELAWSTEEQREFLRNSIADRLAVAAATPAVLQELLEAAATIGLAFSEASLSCMVREASTDPRRAISSLVALGLFERTGSVLRFAHEILQSAAVPADANRQSELHRRFVDCLRVLTPADYDTRALHCHLSGDALSAGTMDVMARLARVRRGFGAPIASMDFPRDSAFNGLRRASTLLVEAVEIWLANDYSRVVELLDAFPPDVPDLLKAERAYLVADAMLKSLETADRVAAIDLLDQWRSRMTEEFDLWFRLETALMVGYAHVNDLDAARATERAIIQGIEARRVFDADASDYLYTLYRKSDALHEIDVAVQRQKQAVAFFRGSSTALVPRHPSEYARATANLVGSLVVLGEYRAAIDQARELITWTQSLPAAPLPRPTIVLNNLLIAEMLSGSASLNDLVNEFERLIAIATRSEDGLLIQSNLAVALVLGGNAVRGLASLEECEAALSTMYGPDAYYLYIVRNNLFGVQLCSSSLPDPAATWQQLGDLVNKIHAPLRPFFERRHSVLASALDVVDGWTIPTWDRYIGVHRPKELGRPWEFYGRGFLLSDIQHWSDG